MSTCIDLMGSMFVSISASTVGGISQPRQTNNKNPAFTVFNEDVEEMKTIAPSTGDWQMPPTRQTVTKENTQKPGKWNESKVTNTLSIFISLHNNSRVLENRFNFIKNWSCRILSGVPKNGLNFNREDKMLHSVIFDAQQFFKLYGKCSLIFRRGLGPTLHSARTKAPSENQAIGNVDL